MIVAVIPARGGSKRLPRKNLKLFAGRPLLDYSIMLARSVPEIDRCIVSTEDDEIAAVALQCGAEVIERPTELASDFATTVSVVQHALRCLIEQGARPEVVVTLQPNCPLRPAGLVQSALQRIGEATDSVISVTESAHKLGQLQNGYFVPSYTVGMRSQDMAPKFYENGLVYVTQASLVLEQGDLFGPRILPVVIDPLYALGDIDTEFEFEIAEMLFHRYRDHFAWAMDEQQPTKQETA